jgi:biopolymer transport protein ExbB
LGCALCRAGKRVASARAGTHAAAGAAALADGAGDARQSGSGDDSDVFIVHFFRRGLLAVSNRHGEAIARVVQKMLDFTTKNPHADLQQVREIAETEGTRVAASLNNRVIYLADIGMIAPLLGLLGTVFGIIRSFGALGADIGSARYIALSRGISEALVNTAAGLAIGIPAMIFYAFFRGRSQKLISELEAASTHVLALLSLQYGRRAERAPVLIEDEL